MKIAIIGQFMPSPWYGSMATYCKRGFESLGFETVCIDRWDKKPIPEDCKYVVVMDCSEDFSDNIPQTMQPKIYWSLDAHMPMGAERSCNMARKCDIVVSSNYEYGVKILEKFGIKSFLVPVTFDDGYCLENKLNTNRDRYEVTMIGHENSPQRRELWNMLGENYKAFVGLAPKEVQYRRAMLHTKIVVNQPTEPWDVILNNRFFEALACRGMLLQKRLQTDLIERMGFVQNVDFVYWSTFEELKTMIDYYLVHESERNDIVNSGFKKVQKYSMKNQCSIVHNLILSELYTRL